GPPVVVQRNRDRRVAVAPDRRLADAVAVIDAGAVVVAVPVQGPVHQLDHLADVGRCAVLDIVEGENEARRRAGALGEVGRATPGLGTDGRDGPHGPVVANRRGWDRAGGRAGRG